MSWTHLYDTKTQPIGCVIQPELHFGEHSLQLSLLDRSDASVSFPRRERNNIIDGVKVKSIGIDHAICFKFNLLINKDNYKLEF
jgi:predicted nucleotidyltransferase